MAYIQRIYTCATLLALIACNETLFADGRKLNPKEQEKYKSTQGEKEASNNGSQYVNSWRNPEGHGHGYDLPAPHASRVPVDDHTIAGKKDILPTMKVEQSLRFDDSIEGYTKGFRPTTPGSSPGVGHYFAGQKTDDVQKNTVKKSTDASHSIAGNTHDFRSTGPVHGPGVGHLFRHTNAQGKP